MATLSRDAQQWYRSNLASLANQASNQVLSTLELSSGKNVVSAAKDATAAAMSVYGENAKVLSNELFDYCMELENVKKFAKSQNGVIDYDFLRDYIESIAEELLAGNYDNLDAMIQNNIHRASFFNTMKNCDKNEVRYARIPSMFNTCAFCIMLGSRGFVYHSEKSASAGMHPNCRCIVVASNDGKMKVVDYDEDYLYGLYKKGFDAAVEEYGKKLGYDETSIKYNSELALKRVLEYMRKELGLH